MRWRDPSRWVDSDMERDASLRYGCGLLLIALGVTVLVVLVGVVVL